MNPTRKRRMAFALLFLAAAAVAGTFIVLALQENLTYLHTPTEVKAGSVPADARFRLGGVVCEGSVQRKSGTLDVEFAITEHTPTLDDELLEGAVSGRLQVKRCKLRKPLFDENGPDYRFRTAVQRVTGCNPSKGPDFLR